MIARRLQEPRFRHQRRATDKPAYQGHGHKPHLDDLDHQSRLPLRRPTLDAVVHRHTHCYVFPFSMSRFLLGRYRSLKNHLTDIGTYEATSIIENGEELMLSEFKDFIAKGNVMDMAVGIIIGAAFTAIVSSLVSDLINPVIGLFTGGLDFTNNYVVLSGEVSSNASLEAAREVGASVFAYGSFIMAVINFLIIALVVFMLVRYVNKVKAIAERPQEVAPDIPTGPSELDVLLEIRDQLKKS